VEPTTSFEDAYRRWYPDVFRYCRRRVGDDLAQDATAEVWATAWRRRDVLAEVDEPLAWLYGVARKTVANARRGRGRRMALADRARSTAEPDAPDTSTEVFDALRRLGEDDRELLRLTAWEGLSGKELAVALGLSEQAARKRLSRARSRLAAELQGANHV
jgi:RNA polymerase sigma-70 factor (ECF subfamily)